MGHGHERGAGCCNGTRKSAIQVTEGEVIAEIETEKAAQELESPADGVLTEIRVQENERAKVRTVLGIIEAAD